ncbi:uncharacterized protein LY89DRAFT_718674 [Mollisia scopiformis]|uniref:Uncharacterized protein n=1 Tax=Mollisia scopiformis TaxID=149040 RepID=A0A194XA02_MOLSC|nr:uncharacterized protein LY89DRAFT_718674 [Mollisia scopiformis]KUJ16964.1 hypothetical protein LY89DRAFT_718674 [Mollisia scopiformis]
MLQDTASRVCAVTAFSLIITILMYTALTRFDKNSQMVEEHIFQPTIYTGWGDGWASLLAAGEPFESTILQSASGRFAFSMKSGGHLLFEDRRLKKNTTIFSQTAGGVHGLEGEPAPEGAAMHARLSSRGTFVVYYDVELPLSTPESPSNEPASRARRSAVMQTKGKRDDESLADLLRLIDENINTEEDDDDKDHGLGSLSTVIWDSNRLPNCHKIPKGAYPPSTPFLQLDDSGLLYISTSNEINCVLKHSED